nr:craniofacial development protein 2-like [Tanacetum cinerariifolium]
MIIAGDLNGHIGANSNRFSSMHEGFGYRVRNEEGITTLEFAVAHDLVVLNSFFKKRDANLITFHSEDHDTKIDYMLVCKEDLRLCKDRKFFLDKANRSASEERYKEAKKEPKKAVARAKEKAHEDPYKRLDSKEGENDIYTIVKARDKRNRDLGNVIIIKDEDGRSIVNEVAIRRR